MTFGPIGEGLKGWVEMLINDVLAENLLAALASMAVAPWALDLVNTVIGGVGSVLSFMPQIMLLFLFLSVLEDSGYMSRAAFLMDGMLLQDRAERQSDHSDADGLWLYGAGGHGLAGAGT